MVEARSVLLLTIVAALALIGLLLTAASQNPVRQWPREGCSQPQATAEWNSDCVGAD